MSAKILFDLEPDEDGYPPIGSETVWATHIENNRYRLCNIPFFAREATLDDVVEVKEEGGVLVYKDIVQRSGNSLIRVIYHNETEREELCRGLRALGCVTELNNIHRIVAVSVPPNVQLEAVQAFLQRGEEQGLWGYEEPILMQ
ncbi:MAG: DUF4265 domain-containing protein [Polyangiaceae bacterium]|nr:DUF4265 domain-containing protein [Polyangiaceae bacterium]